MDDPQRKYIILAPNFPVENGDPVCYGEVQNFPKSHEIKEILVLGEKHVPKISGLRLRCDTDADSEKIALDVNCAFYEFKLDSE